MGEYITFALTWIFIMVLIGIALFIVAKAGKKKSDGKTVDPSTYEVISPFDINKKEKLEKIDEHNKKEPE